MIREHTFNSEWWGEPVGIVSDLAFFARDAAEQRERLGTFAWVEAVTSADEVSPHTMAGADFVHVDTQIAFRLDLRQVPPLPDFADLAVHSAAEESFTIGEDELAVFEHERFRFLPHITSARLEERYRRWANTLIAAQPAWCVQLSQGARVQGWFLSERDDDGFHLTLAALHRDATVSGMLLYQTALNSYATRGQRVGGARFSASNTAVHNIYARLGARFLTPVDYWLWVRTADTTQRRPATSRRGDGGLWRRSITTSSCTGAASAV